MGSDRTSFICKFCGKICDIQSENLSLTIFSTVFLVNISICCNVKPSECIFSSSYGQLADTWHLTPMLGSSIKDRHGSSTDVESSSKELNDKHRQTIDIPGHQLWWVLKLLTTAKRKTLLWFSFLRPSSYVLGSCPLIWDLYHFSHLQILPSISCRRYCCWQTYFAIKLYHDSKNSSWFD